MIIDKNKTYRTRDGREVRVYAVDGEDKYPVHGATKDECMWHIRAWTKSGSYHSSTVKSEHDLIEADPQGILPRHRELLAEELDNANWHSRAESIRNTPFSALTSASKASLIALARLDAERSKVEG